MIRSKLPLVAQLNRYKKIAAASPRLKKEGFKKSGSAPVPNINEPEVRRTTIASPKVLSRFHPVGNIIRNSPLSKFSNDQKPRVSLEPFTKSTGKEESKMLNLFPTESGKITNPRKTLRGSMTIEVNELEAITAEYYNDQTSSKTKYLAYNEMKKNSVMYCQCGNKIEGDEELCTECEELRKQTSMQIKGYLYKRHDTSGEFKKFWYVVENKEMFSKIIINNTRI